MVELCQVVQAGAVIFFEWSRFVIERRTRTSFLSFLYQLFVNFGFLYLLHALCPALFMQLYMISIFFLKVK